jgi:hypothetical protein
MPGKVTRKRVDVFLWKSTLNDILGCLIYSTHPHLLRCCNYFTFNLRVLLVLGRRYGYTLNRRFLAEVAITTRPDGYITDRQLHSGLTVRLGSDGWATLRSPERQRPRRTANAP